MYLFGVCSTCKPSKKQLFHGLGVTTYLHNYFTVYRSSSWFQIKQALLHQSRSRASSEPVLCVSTEIELTQGQYNWC